MKILILFSSAFEYQYFKQRHAFGATGECIIRKVVTYYYPFLVVCAKETLRERILQEKILGMVVELTDVSARRTF
jgi:hypothetical protein